MLVTKLSGETMFPLHAGINGKCKLRSQMHMNSLIITRHVMVCCDIGACMLVFKLACRWY